MCIRDSLVGCALPTFFAPTPLLWGYIVAGSIFSTVLMMAVSSMLRTWKVSAMTGPFVITTWFLMLAAYNFGNIQIISLPHPAISVQPAASDLFALDVYKRQDRYNTLYNCSYFLCIVNLWLLHDVMYSS